MKRQVKRLLPIIFAATVATAANAEDGFSGFYLGAGIGSSINTGTVNGDTSIVVNDTLTGTPVFRETDSFRGGIRGNARFAGSLYAGYGCPVWDPIYIGAEIFITGSSKHKRGLSFVTAETAFIGGFPVTETEAVGIRPRHRSWQYGIDFRPGILLCQESMLYFRIGAGWNKVGYDAVFTRTVAPGPGAAVVASSRFRGHSRSKTKTSLRLGVGLEQQLCDCWTIRADYVYTTHRKHGSGAGAVTTITDPALGSTAVITDRVHSKLHNHTAMLGVSYYFN